MNCLIAGDSMIARIKELETENAALKASIPQIQHDAVMRVAEYGCFILDNGRFGKTAERMKENAANILTQAKEAAE